MKRSNPRLATTAKDGSLTIHFRRVDDPFSMAGVERWQADVFDNGEGTMFPVAMAFVVVVSGKAQLNFILTADQWRRRGYGKQLIRACATRWPNLTATSAMSPGAVDLLKSCGLGRRDDE